MVPFSSTRYVRTFGVFDVNRAISICSSMTQSWWQWLRGWWNIGTFGGSFSALRTKSQKSNARCTMRNEQDSNFHLGRTDADATWAVKNRDFFRIWAHTWVKVGTSLIINICAAKCSECPERGCPQMKWISERSRWIRRISIFAHRSSLVSFLRHRTSTRVHAVVPFSDTHSPTWRPSRWSWG